MTTRSQISLLLLFIVLILFMTLAPTGDRAVAVRTLGLGLGACAIALPIGGLIAWVCLSRGIIARVLFFTCIALLFIPLFMQVSAWDSAFGKLGWISSQYKTLEPLLSGWSAAIWIHAMSAAPQIGLILWFGLRAGGRIHDEQALLDASRNAVFWHVTIRRLIPLLVMAMVWVFICCSREIAVTDIYQIGTLAEQIYIGYSLNELGSILGNWTPEQLAQAQSTHWMLTTVIIGCLSTATLIAGQGFASELMSSADVDPTKQRLNPNSPAKWLVGLALIALIAGVPIANLVIRASFFVQSVDGKPMPGFSAAHFWNSISNVFYKNGFEFRWSSMIAAVTSSWLLIVGILCVWNTRNSRTGKLVLLLSVAVACALPGPLIGAGIVGLFSSFSHPWIVWLYDRTILPPVIATFVFCWPLTTVFVWFALGNTARDTIENARLEGANSFSQLVFLAIAGNWHALSGCLLISFAICFGELSASQMTLPPGMDTVPRVMLGLLHAGVNEMTAAITIVCVVMIVAITIAGWLLVGLKRAGIRRK